MDPVAPAADANPAEAAAAPVEVATSPAAQADANVTVSSAAPVAAAVPTSV